METKEDIADNGKIIGGRALMIVQPINYIDLVNIKYWNLQSIVNKLQISHQDILNSRICISDLF